MPYAVPSDAMHTTRTPSFKKIVTKLQRRFSPKTKHRNLGSSVVKNNSAMIPTLTPPTRAADNGTKSSEEEDNQDREKKNEEVIKHCATATLKYRLGALSLAASEAVTMLPQTYCCAGASVPKFLGA